MRKLHHISKGFIVYWIRMNKHSEKSEDQEHKEKIDALNHEVMELKSQLFKIRDELHTLRNSRVIGRIIKARESAGQIKPKAKKLPRRAVIKTKYLISGVTPSVVKPAVRALLLNPARKAMKVYDVSKSKKANTYYSRIVHVPNKTWDSNAPLVSIIVPYFNRADTIEETIKSVLWQTFTNYELIIVDDGSTDRESIIKLDKIVAENPLIKLIKQKNQGVAAARNNGINKARGNYVICLDSDDMIDPTYIEKCLISLELNQDIGLATTYRKHFGVVNDEFRVADYEPIELFTNNMVTTAAMFRKEAWDISGGYKSNIGYEDWEFWLTLAEHGFWGTLLPEFLFSYRVAMASRYMDDKEVHWNNIKTIQGMHKQYERKIKQIASTRRTAKRLSDVESVFTNLNNVKNYAQASDKKQNVLVTMPWMTFGGAETLIYNYCMEIKDRFNISFITGLKSEHEWEYKFKEITPSIYHLANLFPDKQYHLAFIKNYIKTRDIQILHVIHNGFTFEMLEDIKRQFPNLKVIVTMFNDRVDYFLESTNYSDYIDVFTSDNSKVTKHYKKILGENVTATVIPNGIDCFTTFNADLYDREFERASLKLNDNDLAVFFVGRFSEEKNPDVFVRAAQQVLRKNKSVKFFMIGDGGMRDNIDAMIKQIEGDRVVNLGYQSEVARFLSAADIFVLPSSIEGFPLSILEAMAMKLAVIASDVGAIAEVLKSGDDGFVITPGSADEIYTIITKLEKDRTLLQSAKNNARKKVEVNYSNTALGNNYSKLYKDVIKR